ncbi:MAG: tRNA pseudouridine(13) synthase TruD, partial [Myxococcota bacterium]
MDVPYATSPLPDVAPVALPYATASLPGVGGRIKARFEDFVVDEVLAYAPCGEGEHVYLWVEKRDATTPWAAKQLGRFFGVDSRDIGYAGMKDRRGLTGQWFSLPAHLVEPQALERCVRDAGAREGAQAVVAPGVWVRRASRHGNKIKRGHVRGNSFDVRIRALSVRGELARQRVSSICAALEGRGLPNFFGEQRFGKGGRTLQVGLRVVRGQEGVG